MDNERNLTPIAKDIWCSESWAGKGPFKFGIRMTVVRLESGGLWLHSPIRIDSTLAAELKEIGTVEHIVAPNRFHHLHASQAKMLYPDATLWAAPGLSQKRKDINFDAILTEKKPEWGNSIEFQHIAGVPILNEVVFFHSPSRSLICSDILFNIHEGTNFLVRAAWKLFGVWKKFGQDRFWRFMVKDKDMVTKSINNILSWKFESVIMAHGDITDCDRYQLYEILKKNNKDIVLI